MKKRNLLVVVTLLMVTLIPLSAQESTKSTAFYPSFGIGIGFFYPGDVNDYIAYDLSNYITYNQDMYMYLEVKGGVTYRLKVVDFSAMLEFDVAPKFTTGASETFTYFFTRVAPEVSVNYYIPTGSGKNAFFIGGGVSYAFLKFENYSSSAPGFKAQLGYSMQFGKFNMQPYAAFRYNKAKDNGFELDFTGGQIGLILSSHPRIMYK